MTIEEICELIESALGAGLEELAAEEEAVLRRYTSTMATLAAAFVKNGDVEELGRIKAQALSVAELLRLKALEGSRDAFASVIATVLNVVATIASKGWAA